MTGNQENTGKAISIPLLFLPAEEYWKIKSERQIGPKFLRVLNIRLNIFSLIWLSHERPLQSCFFFFLSKLMAYINLLLIVIHPLTSNCSPIPISSTLYSHCSTVFSGSHVRAPPFQDSLYHVPRLLPYPEILQLKQKCDCIIPQLKVHQQAPLSWRMSSKPSAWHTRPVIF